ncbi:hypothetical protein K461DRAFT_91621 [Myriangium duriaei CBS 260.36]|uniref:Uncharacterized protein n=1 Tax=Myriangium duriaei CBS 260.36 TaxID=1168546 RepID=A0A9P4JC67_9PEZI|nr:hypothetical protein K461DRAFT_91621 [Myriangium duriaei CBS 260.36]
MLPASLYILPVVVQNPTLTLQQMQLSSDFNLIFVANGSRILIGEPSFPSQSLPDDFPLIIDTPPSAPRLSGYLDPGEPHSINNLLAHRLGSEEILVAVRDDGDVDAYLVRHIFEALQQSKISLRTLGSSTTDVRPMIHRNVGKSAWGLAVHTEARMIAVSSNNHEFNIFSFALIDNGNASDDSPSISHSRNDDTHAVVPNGEANIPCISFCNTGDDPEGRWLLTADVSGLVRSWDLLGRKGDHSFHIGCQTRTSTEYNAEASGWIVAFLDPRLFVAVDKFEDRVPKRNDLWNSVLNHGRSVWDMTAEKILLLSRNESKETVLTSPSATTRGVPQAHEFVTSNHSDDTNQPKCVLHENTNHCLLDAVGIVSPLAEIKIEFVDGAEDESDYSLGTESDLEAPMDLVAEDLPPILDDERELGPEVAQHREFLRLLLRREYLATGQSMPALMADDFRPRARNFHMVFNDKGATCPNIPCPIFYSSVREMYMLQPPSLAAPAVEDHFPVVLMGDHWHVRSPPAQDRIITRHSWLHSPHSIERGCMFAQIPSMGVVVVGNQMGRVAIMSGFKTQQHLDIPVGDKSRVKTYKWVYGLRLEVMLPFASQEAAGSRPYCMLYGMAVAPMQGTQHLPDDQKRWRLMFMYVDDTVFSYEIKRKPDQCGVAVSDIMI